jgi:HEPN domain-containing protein
MNAGNRWAAFARETLQMAEAAQKLGLWNQVCLQTHRAAANSLKAFLSERHRPIPQVQHLSELLAICVEANAELARFEDACYGLEKYLIPLTYPDAVPLDQASNLPSEKDASQALATLLELREALQVI